MRNLIPTLFLLLLPGTVLAGGGLDSGGGVRTNGQVTVVDVLGLPVSGTAAGGGITASNGLLYSLSRPTPVALSALEVAVGEDGVTLSWRAPAEAGVARFTVERADGVSGAGGFARLGPGFNGPGPHRYVDGTVVAGAGYRYRLRALLRSGDEEFLGPWPVEVEEAAVPAVERIRPAFPNPFRDAFVLSVSLPREEPVRWRLLDVRGAVVAASDLGPRPAGTISAAVRAPAEAPGGVYFLEVQVGARREVQKVVRLR